MQSTRSIGRNRRFYTYRRKSREKVAIAHNRSLQSLTVELVNALAFYAYPETYFGIGFISDPPSGEFMDDFDDTDMGEKPGRLARKTIKDYYYRKKNRKNGT